jgi:protein Mpv17
MSLFYRLLWKPYLDSLERKPLLIKALTAGSLVAAGDVIAQKYEKLKNPVRNYMLDRTLRFFAVGLFCTGPLMHYWYRTLDATITISGTTGALAKLALDQTIFAPIIISIFFTSNGIMSGNTWRSIMPQLKEDLWPTLQTNWTVWPFAMLINFKFIPPAQRVLYVSSVSLLWNTYLCQVASNRSS